MIKSGTPFRAASMMAAVLGAIAASVGFNSVRYQQEVQALGPYEGRGKGRTRNHDRGGNRAYQRAAAKARNVKRHRASLKG